MSDKQTIVLSFFADGPYYEDLIDLLAIPSGMSYRHQFRYEPQWISQACMQFAESANGQNQARELEVIVGARFYNRTEFLPLRKAKIAHLSQDAGIYQFYFTVNELVDARSAQALTDLCYALPLNNELCLLHRFSKTPTFCDKRFDEAQSWGTLVGLIGACQTLPIKDKARQSVFLRVASVHKGGNNSHEDIVKKIRTTSIVGDVFGWKFLLHQQYGLQFTYKVPFLQNKKTSAGILNLEFSSPNNGLVAQRGTLELVGNYGNSLLFLEADEDISESKMSFKLPEEITAQNGDKIYGHEFQYSFSSKFNIKSSLTRTILPSLALFVSFSVLSAIGLLTKIFKTSDASTALSTGQYIWFIVIVALMAGLATTAIHYIKK